MLPHLTVKTQCLNIVTLDCFQKMNVGNLLIFREKVLELAPKSVCAVEMTMYDMTMCFLKNLFLLLCV